MASSDSDPRELSLVERILSESKTLSEFTNNAKKEKVLLDNLKTYCTNHELECSGRKDVLIQRIFESSGKEVEKELYFYGFPTSLLIDGVFMPHMKIGFHTGSKDDFFADITLIIQTSQKDCNILKDYQKPSR